MRPRASVQRKLMTARLAVNARVLRQATLDKSTTVLKQPVLKQRYDVSRSISKPLTRLPVLTPLRCSQYLPLAFGADHGQHPSRERESTIALEHGPVTRPNVTSRVQPPPAVARKFVVQRAQAQQPRTVTVQRRSKRKQLKSSFRIRPSDYGDFHELSSLFGLDGTRAEPAVLIAIDTESERHGSAYWAVEIGITTLDTRDICGVEPGKHIRNWTSQMRHHHLVLDITRKPRYRMRSNPTTFGESHFVSTTEAGSMLRTILRESIKRTHDQSTTNTEAPLGSFQDSPKVIFVGQSLGNDIATLRGAPLNIDLHDPSDAGLTASMIFDTYALTRTARNMIGDDSTDPRIPGRLGPLVAFLGVDPLYIDPESQQNVAGTHNAGNDAAFTMMALLLYALRWKEITQGAVLPKRSSGSLDGKNLHRDHAWSFVGWLAFGAVAVGGVGATFNGLVPAA